MPPEPKNPLHAKLAEVLKEVGYIPKNGTNENQHYKFVAAADVADKVRESFAKHGLTLVPTGIDVIGQRRSVSDKMDITDIRGTFLLTDPESGYGQEIVALGSGADTGDKGIYKAMTGMLKYALLMSLQIPTGDDPEADTNTDRLGGGQSSDQPVPRPTKATQAEIKKFFARADETGMSTAQIKNFCVIAVQKDDSRQFTTADIDTLLAKLDEPGLVDFIKKDIKDESEKAA